jgi:hypothetical protein
VIWTRERPLDPPDDPHTDEIGALMDERDYVWHRLCEAEDVADTEAIEAHQTRIAEIDREVDYIASGERDEDWMLDFILMEDEI